MDKLHITIFLLLGVAIFLGGMGVVGVQNVSNTNLEDAVNDLIQKDKLRKDTLQDLKLDMNTTNTEVVKLVNDIYNKIQLNKNQIVKNKLSFDREHPAIGNIPDPDPGSSTPTPTPTFTVNIEKTTYTAGENIVFSGVGLPGKPVFIVITAPDNSIAPQSATTSDENGNWLVEFSSEFDWALGTWTARATMVTERSDPIHFELVE